MYNIYVNRLGDIMRFKDLYESNYEKLNEASLGRIYQHVQKQNIDRWAILTSWRSDDTKEENEANFKELKNKLRQLGYGFIEMEGVGQEEKDGQVIESKEPSLFIPKIKNEEAQKLADEYNQFGYIYSGPDVDDRIVLIVGGQIDKDSIMDTFHPMKISQFYSKIKGKPFFFESIVTNNWIEGMYWSKCGKAKS
jgi:hypothetical protein